VAGIVALTAPGARLAMVRVLDADGRGDMWSVAAGIYWAIARGARVINMSLGSVESSEAVQYALARADEAGVVCVASAGNRASDQPREYPARSSHVLAIAAVDAQGVAAPFTSYGDHVAMSAPGVGVRSTWRDGGYAIWSGTSMSAPFVSGTAALLIGVHPNWRQADVMNRLRSTARPLDALNPGLAPSLGAGALDAGAALAPDRGARGSGGRTPRIVY
jgi:subtilisin family serine protease